MMFARRFFMALLMVSLAGVACFSIAQASEMITSFSSTITVRLDGSAEIVDVIDYAFAGNLVRHGIVFDLSSRVPSGLETTASNLQVDRISRDGVAETYSVESNRPGIFQVKIGDADKLLAVGLHRYEVHYTVSKLVAQFGRSRSLTFSTGKWSFPIQAASVTIKLPQAMWISSIEATEGGYPSPESQFKRQSSTEVTVHPEHSLAPNEELAVKVLASAPIDAPLSRTPRFLKVTAGPVQSCALTIDGALYCWDLLDVDGTPITSPVRLKLPALTDFDLGDAGQGCGVDQGGGVLCWTPLVGRSIGAVLPADVQVFAANARFVKVSAGSAHICALDDGGSIWCGGNNAKGQLGTGDTSSHPSEMVQLHGLGKAVDVSAGVDNSCAALASGEAWCWGTDSPVASAELQFDSPVPIRIARLNGIFAVHDGRNFMCALEATAVDCWGSNALGQLGATAEVMAGRGAAIVRMPSGRPTSIGAGVSNACAAFQVGLVACWGDWHDIVYAPRPVEGLPLVRTVSVNVDKACVLTANDEVWCWGDRLKGLKDRQFETTYTAAPWRVIIPND